MLLSKYKFTIFTKLILLFLLIAILIGLKYNYSYLIRPKGAGIPGILRHPNIDYLFVGSSLTGQSIDVRLFDSTTNKLSYNLSYNSLHPAAIFELLNYILNSTNININTIIVEAYPYKILVPYVIEDTRLFTDSPPPLKTKLIESLRQYGSLPFPALFELVITSDNESLLIYPINNKIIDSFFYNGAYINKFVPGQKSFPKKEFISSKQLPSCKQIQYDAYAKIIDLCNQKRVKLIFVEPFLPKQTQESKSYIYAKSKVLEALQKAGGTIYECKLFQIDDENPSYFADGLHLSSKGRELWTREISRILFQK